MNHLDLIPKLKILGEGETINIVWSRKCELGQVVCYKRTLNFNGSPRTETRAAYLHKEYGKLWDMIVGGR